MDTEAALAALSAISHRTRLEAFRLLVRSGAEGLPAGEIARRLSVPQTTMSTHLAILARAELIEARRQSRVVFYALQPEGVRALLGFLVADCCDGRPELCASLRTSECLQAN